jgi:uncharacterized Zn finger protein
MGYWYDKNPYEDKTTLRDYKTPADAILVQGPIHALIKRGEIGTQWWGKQWVQTIAALGYDGRLERGKSYARKGSVRRLELSYGMVYAQVQGSEAKPYRTAIHLNTLSDKQWELALNALSQEAIYVAKLLAGEMPSDIEDLFQEQGLSLFPRRRNDIKFECSCPDYGDPCKHAAAIYYLVAEELDKDPFLLLHLRGRSRSAILKGIGSGETALLDDSSDEKPLPIEDFWLGLPEDLKITRPEKIEALALRQLGEAPLFLGSQLKVIYREVAESIEKRLGDA